MSRWWAWRVLWLVLGVLTGVIAFLPESAKTLTGGVAVIFMLATLILLGRWAFVTISEKVKSALKKPDPDKVTLVDQELMPGASLQFEARKVSGKRSSASQSETVLSRLSLAGYQFRTILNTKEEKLEPRKKALMWDSVLFASGIVLCAALASLVS
jgi:cytochrome bd-type quinol oxidase subunit 2